VDSDRRLARPTNAAAHSTVEKRSGSADEEVPMRKSLSNLACGFRTTSTGRRGTRRVTLQVEGLEDRLALSTVSPSNHAVVVHSTGPTNVGVAFRIGNPSTIGSATSGAGAGKIKFVLSPTTTDPTQTYDIHIDNSNPLDATEEITIGNAITK
jgi:hypothetical protein